MDSSANKKSSISKSIRDLKLLTKMFHEQKSAVELFPEEHIAKLGIIQKYIHPRVKHSFHKERIKYITIGSIFYNSKQKKVPLYCAYCPKSKAILFEESDTPLDVNKMTNKIPLNDISAIKIESSDNAITQVIKEGRLTLCLKIFTKKDENEYKFFSDYIYDITSWQDGINILLQKDVDLSDILQTEIQSMTNLWTYTSLLNLKNINI